MIESLIVSNILLWVAVMALLVAVIALSRQIGILYERIAPMGALMMDTGPKVGEAAPVLDLLPETEVELNAKGAASGLQ